MRLSKEGMTGILSPQEFHAKPQSLHEAARQKSLFAALRETLIMLQMHYDLLIVGAGPAGSFAAELLAKGGAKVALFDGRPAGEPKACGGGVTAKAPGGPGAGRPPDRSGETHR